VGPGLYETQIDAPESGSYESVIKPASGSHRLAPVIAGSTVLEGAEYRAKQSNDDLLAAIAERSGGRLLKLAAPEQADLFNRHGIKAREAIIPIWRLLLVWVLGLFMLDIATRRVAWDRWISRRFRPEIEAELAAERVRGAGAERTVAGLRAKLEPDDVAPPVVAAPLALSDADARSLAQAARDRRRAERLTGPKVPPAAPPTGERGAGVPEGTSAPQTSEPSLLAAKRRAAQRFEDEHS
jgi:hypothetical protein